MPPQLLPAIRIWWSITPYGYTKSKRPSLPCGFPWKKRIPHWQESCLDADSSDYVFKEYALDGIVEQSISKFAGDFIARNIRLNYTPSGETVVTDEKWLSFVIEQVLSNALKYTREGEIRVFWQEPKTLCIADTGIGIDPADLPRVFEKGYTGFNGRSDKRASGIGLYLCRKICQNLGVKIHITSKPGEGTNVFLDLAQYQLNRE